MLEELWKKLRGIDRWPETEAEVTGIFRFDGRRNRKLAVVSLRYKDENGHYHSPQFRVDSYSPIYNFSMGEITSVRYNPASPDRCWPEAYGLPVQTPLLLVWLVAATALLLYVLITSNT